MSFVLQKKGSLPFPVTRIRGNPDSFLFHTNTHVFTVTHRQAVEQKNSPFVVRASYCHIQKYDGHAFDGESVECELLFFDNRENDFSTDRIQTICSMFGLSSDDVEVVEKNDAIPGKIVVT